MTEPARVLLVLGALFLAGLLTDLLGRRTFLPRVTLLLLFGIAVGPSGLNLLEGLGERWFPFVTNTALVIVGFLLGGKLTRSTLRSRGRDVFTLSLSISLATAAVVGVGLWLIGLPLELSLVLAAAATATDPAATTDVIREVRAKGPFTTGLVGIVALDDVWGLTIFSVLLAIADTINGAASFTHLAAILGRELGGALLVGAALGIPVAYASGRLSPGEPTLVEALGAVFLCGGIALWLNVSFLLAAMTMGAIVANLARHHNRPFHAIEGIEWPFMILFFVLAGANLRLESLAVAGLAAGGYCVLRVAGRIAGAWIGSLGSTYTNRETHRFGFALLPQAGVALGIALVGAGHLDAPTELLMPVIIAATVAFEIAGPIATRYAIVSLGEAGRES